jgi:hypothetical protein
MASGISAWAIALPPVRLYIIFSALLPFISPLSTGFPLKSEHSRNSAPSAPAKSISSTYGAYLRKLSSISSTVMPVAYSEATILPALEPAIIFGLSPASSRALRAPMCDAPRMPPPDNASPRAICLPPYNQVESGLQPPPKPRPGRNISRTAADPG